MRDTQAIIERVRQLSANVQQIDLAVDQAVAQLQPGQAVLARLLERTAWDVYLRDLWIPVNLSHNTLTIETLPDRTYTPGQGVSLLSPVGRPFPVRLNRQHVLLIADDTLPTPFVWLARQLVAARVETTLVLGGQATRYPLELLPREVEILRSDTGWTWPDQVEAFTWADQVLVCASQATRAAVYRRTIDAVRQVRQQLVPDNSVCGLYYERLACGTGVCQGCQVPGSNAGLLACSDGPAVDLKQVTFE